MRTASAILSALLLAAPGAASAQSLSQLAEAAGGDPSFAEVPPPPPAAAMPGLDAEQPDFDFLVRPEAEHDPGAELYTPEDFGFGGDYGGKAVAAPKKIPYLEIARAEASAQGVDLALVLAVIQKESSFNPNAHSSAGAKGLMQLLPDTARWLGLRDTSQLTKPAVNIKYGVKYIKFLWGEFAEVPSADLSAADLQQKSVRMAIAAYNAGQGNVRKYNDVPPFKETRNYVKKVTEYFSQYEAILAAAPAP